jgi:hypothetical protein
MFSAAPPVARRADYLTRTQLRRGAENARGSKLVIRSDCKASPPHQCFCRLGCAISAQRPIRPCRHQKHRHHFSAFWRRQSENGQIDASSSRCRGLVNPRAKGIIDLGLSASCSPHPEALGEQASRRMWPGCGGLISPGDANGSRERAPDNRLRIVRRRARYLWRRSLRPRCRPACSGACPPHHEGQALAPGEAHVPADARAVVAAIHRLQPNRKLALAPNRPVMLLIEAELFRYI